ncbi:hypothetical protein ACS0TY_035337 [Phlomoides rotata]
MELQFSFLLLEFSLILSGFLFQESAGFGFPSSVASMPDLRLFGARHRILHFLIASKPRKLNIPSNAYAPSPSYPSKKGVHGYTSSSSNSAHKNHHFRKRVHHIAPETYHEPHRAHYSRKGHAFAPSASPLSSSKRSITKGPLPLPAIPSNHLHGPSLSPTVSPMISPMVSNMNTLQPLPSMALPPPPPNQGCGSVKCSEPLTYTPAGSSCACVSPVEVRLRSNISLFAEEIAAGIPLNRSQVRIMGADAADHQLEKTTVLINLVPLDETFKAASAFSIYKKFWNRELSIKSSKFGVYEVLYIHYPGLPPSPPAWPSDPATIDIHPYPGDMNNDGPLKPIGVDVSRRRKSESNKNVTAIIVLPSVTAFVVIMGFILPFLTKWRRSIFPSRQGDQQGLIPSDGKSSAYTGSAKVFSIEEIERATDNFNASRILGEGGFGLVYGGILEDGREVAMKVLKRDDKQGSREFLAEVEMLGRLHHRNLVKLIGICAEDHCRCLVYELVPNGSVEADKETTPLDWCARMKIALGAARGLAYLHEDSSPRVIHRDFKASNILLEHDYTPKVSDFGLARAAMDGSKHISTHVMGTVTTFSSRVNVHSHHKGYLAPEYAMTGHLLVKSDVNSYSIVLLEVLTGRKPVALSQPPGQENLVAWARPLLATREGLETIIDPKVGDPTDPSLKSNEPLDNLAKVAAIASMCVQPEVSHRPFMGEVVQALKLVCNEFEETREPVSRSFSHDEFSVNAESSKHSRISNENVDDLERGESRMKSKILAASPGNVQRKHE